MLYFNIGKGINIGYNNAINTQKIVKSLGDHNFDRKNVILGVAPFSAG